MLPQRELEKKNITHCLSSPLLPLVKPVFASLPPFYSTCYFLLIIFFPLSFSEWAHPSRSIRRLYWNPCAILAKQNVSFYTLASMFMHWDHNGIFNHLIWGPPLRLSRTMRKEQQDGDGAERFPPFMLHGVDACSVSFLLCFTPRCLRLLVSLFFVLCLSPHVSHPILQLQDYRAEGRSRCALD